MRKPLLILSLIALLASACTKTIPQASYDIIPRPKEVQLDDGKPFELTPNTVIHYEHSLKREAQFLSEYMNDILGYMLEIKAINEENVEPDKTVPAGIILCLKPQFIQQAEGYEIYITPKQMVIQGADAAGVFYGIQTLRKSLPTDAENDKIAFPYGSIHDWPEFSYRGMHLDPCRHFIDIDSVKIYLDMMAMHNMNQFHFHLSDDQGWRVEIKRHPELTEKGAYRKNTVIGHNSNIYDSIPHGGFYTQDELRDLVKYAAESHINIIPEIDLPGHMQAALACYPQMGCTGGPYEVWCRWGVSEDVLCAGNEEAMLFAEDVLNEVMDVFPSPYIHIGGDECPKVRWKQCPKCQAKIKQLGIKGDSRFSAEDYLQSYVMNRMAKVVESRGRRVIGWDEIMEGDISGSAVIMSWRSTESGIEAARKGHDVIMVPTSHLYFDYYQSDDIAHEPLSIGGYVPVERVYSFSPIQDELTAEERSRILGIQANIWTEYIASFKHVQYMALPRMAALSELQWCEPEQRDYEAFTQRCVHMAQLYDLYSYNYAKHIFNPQANIDTIEPNLATRKPIALREEPAEKYAYDGAPTLNDGILGHGIFNSGRWLGFCGTPLDAVIDLEQTMEINHVRFRSLTNKGAWIYNPKQVRVLISDDNVCFTEAGQESFTISSWSDNDGIFTYEVDLAAVKARYVEIVIEGHDLPADHDGYGNPAWLFVDEIEVL